MLSFFAWHLKLVLFRRNFKSVAENCFPRRKKAKNFARLRRSELQKKKHLVKQQRQNVTQRCVRRELLIMTSPARLHADTYEQRVGWVTFQIGCARRIEMRSTAVIVAAFCSSACLISAAVFCLEMCVRLFFRLTIIIVFLVFRFCLLVLA